MFDKTKERIARLEETNETFRAAKQHVETYKFAYLAGACCLGVGFIGGKHFQRPIEITVEPVFNNLPTFNNTVAPLIAPIFNNTVNNGGYARKIIRCIETDEMWPSMKAAAAATGNTMHAMSSHCNERLPDLQGLHYVIDGLATN